jgi:hypothetical protein
MGLTLMMSICDSEDLWKHLSLVDKTIHPTSTHHVQLGDVAHLIKTFESQMYVDAIALTPFIEHAIKCWESRKWTFWYEFLCCVVVLKGLSEWISFATLYYRYLMAESEINPDGKRVKYYSYGPRALLEVGKKQILIFVCMVRTTAISYGNSRTNMDIIMYGRLFLDGQWKTTLPGSISRIGPRNEEGTRSFCMIKS